MGKHLNIAFNMVFVVIAAACANEERYAIEPDLELFVDRFYSEGEARGLIIERENLIVMIKNDLNKIDQAWGLSKRKGGQRFVYIDREYYDDMLRGNNLEEIEFLVFHELGHALLGRGHLTGVKSIMNTGWTSYYGQRKEFIDELFLSQ